MQFKKWLKEHQFGASDAKDICFAPTKCKYYNAWDTCKKLGKCPREDSITVQALGDWAWENLLQHKPWCDKKGFSFKKIFCKEDSVSFQIAIGCLGRKEIEKRLREDQAVPPNS